MGGEHEPRMFYGFMTSTIYKQSAYNWTPCFEYSMHVIYYCKVLKSIKLSEINKEIAEYELAHADEMQKMREYALSKGKTAEWIIGEWGELSSSAHVEIDEEEYEDEDEDEDD